MVQPLGSALLGHLVEFPQEGRQLQRLEVMSKRSLGVSVMRHPSTPDTGNWPPRSCRQWRAVDRGRRQGQASVALLHLAQHKVLDGVKTYRPHAQCGFDRGMEVFHPEALQQAENLNVFPA